MAKRKLSPARPEFLTAAPETKSALPPIAQVAGDVATVAALTEVSEALAKARAEGRLIQPLPLHDIALDHLVRDRLHLGDEDLDALTESLRARGQQTPIEVVDRGDAQTPRYGLISGLRRVTALRRLAETDPQITTALAIIRTPESAAEAYLAMVEENEIRVGLSYYERARIVVKAIEAGVYLSAQEALRSLFGNVSRAKRSKIKSFMTLVEALDDVLHHPTAISERQGLDLARQLERPGAESTLRARLAATDGTQDAERAALEAPLSEPRSAPPAPSKPAARRPHVLVTRQGDRLELHGPGVDASFEADLLAWLKKRGQSRP